MRGPLLVFFVRPSTKGRVAKVPKGAWPLLTQCLSLKLHPDQVFVLLFNELIFYIFCFTVLNIIKTVKYFHTVVNYRAQDRLRCGGTSSDDEDSDNKEASMQLIQLDISRTFPHLCIFQKVQ